MGKTFRSEEDSEEYEDVSRRRKEHKIKGFLRNKKIDKREEYPTPKETTAWDYRMEE